MNINVNDTGNETGFEPVDLQHGFYELLSDVLGDVVERDPSSAQSLIVESQVNTQAWLQDYEAIRAHLSASRSLDPVADFDRLQNFLITFNPDFLETITRQEILDCLEGRLGRKLTMQDAAATTHINLTRLDEDMIRADIQSDGKFTFEVDFTSLAQDPLAELDRLIQGGLHRLGKLDKEDNRRRDLLSSKIADIKRQVKRLKNLELSTIKENRVLHSAAENDRLISPPEERARGLCRVLFPFLHEYTFYNAQFKVSNRESTELDLLCPVLGSGIEIDGSHHQHTKAKDGNKDAWLYQRHKLQIFRVVVNTYLWELEFLALASMLNQRLAELTDSENSQ